VGIYTSLLSPVGIYTSLLSPVGILSLLCTLVGILSLLCTLVGYSLLLAPHGGLFPPACSPWWVFSPLLTSEGGILTVVDLRGWVIPSFLAQCGYSSFLAQCGCCYAPLLSVRVLLRTVVVRPGVVPGIQPVGERCTTVNNLSPNDAGSYQHS